MASQGKKQKKSKGKTLALNDFLQETPGPAPSIPIRKSSNLNWADEVEDAYDNFDSRPKPNVVLPTAPKAARGLDDFSDKVPQNPPYMAYLSNLPYDVDEDEIADFFGHLKIANMKIPKDDRGGEMPKLKGYGYIEFADRDSLIGALSTPDCTLKNRRIRIDVASGSDNERRRGGRMDMGRDRPERPEVSMGDWRSGPRNDPTEAERRGPSRDTSSTVRDSSSSWRDMERSGGFRDGERKFDRDGDRSSRFNRDGDRGGRFERDGDRGGRFERDGDRGRFERDGDRRGGGGGFERRGYEPRNGGGGFYRGAGSVDEERDKAAAEARQRPKLNLQPRTKPMEETVAPPPAEKEPEVAKPAPVPAASIFGSAKPVDTSARERQIEERLAKASEEKKDDRGRDDRSLPRRASPTDRRRFSPRRRSPDRRQSPPRRRSPERRRTPDRRRTPERRRSPRQSPEGRHSPDYRREESPRRRSPSPRGGGSPDHRSPSPDSRRRPSPNRRKSDDAVRHVVADDVKTEKTPPPPVKEKPRREKEMPKLKEPQPPNFVGSNKYAFLASDEDEN